MVDKVRNVKSESKPNFMKNNREKNRLVGHILSYTALKTGGKNV